MGFRLNSLFLILENPFTKIDVLILKVGIQNHKNNKPLIRLRFS